MYQIHYPNFLLIADCLNYIMLQGLLKIANVYKLTYTR
jgi:hypothetical protein